MASKKTSEENNGAPIQGSDLVRIARTGSNYKLTSEDIFVDTLTSGQLSAKIAANELIAGRYYKVGGLSGDPSKFNLVLANSNNTVISIYSGVNSNQSKQTIKPSIFGSESYTIDGYGNKIIYGGSNGSFPIVYSDNFVNTEVKGDTGDSFFNNENATFLDCVVSNSTINGVTEDYFRQTKFENTVLNGINTGTINLNFNNCTFKNVVINVTDVNSDNFYLSNCHFENVEIQIANGVIIENLTIQGTIEDSKKPLISFDGDFQSFIFDNFAGYINCDIEKGYSTVRGILQWANDGTYHSISNISNVDQQIILYPFSPVGTYYINENSQDAKTISIKEIIGAPTFYSTTFKWGKDSYNVNKNIIEFTCQTTSIGIGENEILQFHNINANERKLATFNCFITTRYKRANENGDSCNHIEFARHYD